MAKDNIFRIIYAILYEIRENANEGKKTPKENISPERFGINDSRWLDIMEELIDNGYIKGMLIRNTKSGRLVSGIEDIALTLDGEAYLRDNTMMKKVAEALKDAKDILPFV